MTLSLSVLACCLWGISDFIGGFKSKQMPPVTVIFISSVFSLVTISVILAVRPEGAPSLNTALWAAITGVFGLFSMYFLYKGLSMGMMSVVAPIAASGVVLPVLAGIIKGDTLSAVQTIGILAALVGVYFVSAQREAVRSKPELSRALRYAFLAAVFSGLYLVSIAKTGRETPFWAIFFLRTTYVVVLLPIVMLKKRGVRLGISQYATLAGMGMVDTFAGLAYVLATGIGLLSVVSVISSLYPAVTVLLSVGLLRERLNINQMTGVFLSFGGIILLSI